MPNCQYCDKPLVSIGTARENGKRTHSDWDTRKLHKKCWKEQKNFSYIYNKCLPIKNNTLRDIIFQKIV